MSGHRRHPQHRHPLAAQGEFGRDVVVAGHRLTPEQASVGVGAALGLGAKILFGVSTGWSIATGIAAWLFTKNNLEK